LLVFVFQWAFRSTFPRLRIDQLQAFCWKFLVPAAVLNLLVTAFLVYFFPIVNAEGTLAPQGAAGWLTTLVGYLVGNALVIGILAFLYRGQVRRSVAQFEAREESGVQIAPLEREAATV
ncbi:MAG: NADH-quinone oxidoreductase subunit H, partial [Ardenticatenaceae bacterium]